MKRINYIISIYGNFDIEGTDEEDCQDHASNKKEEIRKHLEKIGVLVGDIEQEDEIEYDKKGKLKPNY